jgi:hypothetical protein
MQLTILPDKVDRPFASNVAESTVRQANYSADDPRHEPILAGLMQSWVDAACRYDRWQKANPGQARILGREANRWTLTFAVFTKAKALPVLSSHPYAGEGEPRRERIDTREYTGYQAFVTFLVCAAPRFDMGKCDRCHKFFWNRWGHANKRFCSRKCTVIGTATERQARKVAKLRQKKNKRINRALESFFWDKPATADWKKWVADRAGVTQSYLTRAINLGRRGEPDGVRLTKLQSKFLEEISMKGEK